MNIDVTLDPAAEELLVRILSPGETEELADLLSRLEGAEKKLLGFRDGGAVPLEPGDILRFYGEDKEVRAQTLNGEVCTVRQRLYELEERLDKRTFVRVSHSEIVNWKRVTALDLSLSGTIRVTLGAAFKTAGVPFLLERRTALWSGAHFLVTAAVFSLAGWQCRWFPIWESWLCLLGLLLLLYVLKWSVRFLEWQADIRAIRKSSGLDTAEPPWKTLAPYLLLAAGVELLLPPALMLVDARDFPVLTGVFYPFVILPLFCFFSACPLATRLPRWWLVYPPACMLLTLPCIALVYNSSALFHLWMTGIPALAGGLLGTALRRLKKRIDRWNKTASFSDKTGKGGGSGCL